MRTVRSTCVGVRNVIREFIWTAILYSSCNFGQVFLACTVCVYSVWAIERILFSKVACTYVCMYMYVYTKGYTCIYVCTYVQFCSRDHYPSIL